MRVASISGGRSSAMMLKILIDNGFGSEPGDIVCFCNTGREHNATLDFVQECSIRWNIPIIWLEYRSQKPKFEVVTYETAARRETGSRPFTELLSSGRGILPNPVKRFCTVELKIKTVRRYVRTVLKHRGLIPTFIGLRYDEPTRVARKKAQNAAGKEPEWVEMPLNDMKITVNERDIFWGGQPFNLAINSHSDNCDFCFLKSKWQQIRRIREEPDAIEWWIEQEERAKISAKRKRNGQFRKEYSFKKLKEIASTQLYLDMPEPENKFSSISCACTD